MYVDDIVPVEDSVDSDGSEGNQCDSDSNTDFLLDYDTN